MRTGVTIRDVTRAADQLLTAGERPTVESVRALLGTGAARDGKQAAQGLLPGARRPADAAARGRRRRRGPGRVGA